MHAKLIRIFSNFPQLVKGFPSLSRTTVTSSGEYLNIALKIKTEGQEKCSNVKIKMFSTVQIKFLLNLSQKIIQTFVVGFH